MCFELATGKQMWDETLSWKDVLVRRGRTRTVTRGSGRGCLLAVDGDYLCMGEFGSLLWMQLRPGGYRILSRAKLFDAPESWGVPVLSRGLLYISQNFPDNSAGQTTRLLCYDVRAAENE